jgi:hypothetical protein
MNIKKNTNPSPIVKLGMETSSTFDPDVTVEQHVQDLRDFINVLTDDQLRKFKIGNEILTENINQTEQFKNRTGI